MELNRFEVQYTDVEGADFSCLQCSEGMYVGSAGQENHELYLHLIQF
jgi:hypothetical protein